MPDLSSARQMPAPLLREVALTRWDLDIDPVIQWNAAGTAFWLATPDLVHRVLLVRLSDSCEAPDMLAAALAETVAPCDFPPTDDHASQSRLAAALRVAGHGEWAATMVAPQS